MSFTNPNPSMQNNKLQKSALFLDRDGVINRQIPGDYISDWSQFEFLPGVIDALKLLQKRYAPIVVVTNQQGIGKGLMQVEQLHAVHYYMRKVLAEKGVKLDSIYFCPNLEQDQSECRKPNTGMALLAKADYPSIDFSRSVLVGDSDSDIAMGQQMGMFTVKINPNKRSDDPLISSDLQVGSLWEWASQGGGIL